MWIQHLGRILPESGFCNIEYQYGSTIPYLVADCVLAHIRAHGLIQVEESSFQLSLRSSCARWSGFVP